MEPIFAGYPSNGFQQSPAVFLMGSGGNHVSSLGRQRTTSQMIPTPGLSSNSIHSDSSMGSGNGDGCSTVDPTTGPRQHQKKPHVMGQNSHALRSLSNHSGGGIRSGLQQQSFGSSNGGIGKGLGVTGKNAQLGNVSETSEGQLTATSHASSANQLPTNFDQFQKHLMHGIAIANSSLKQIYTCMHAHLRTRTHTCFRLFDSAHRII